ncbi:MAG TPA: ChaN family lipoprotein [Nitrospiraceae bacterium]|nr:ChaN family lipoprotein [Nitrospiraceae bacterium]
MSHVTLAKILLLGFLIVCSTHSSAAEEPSSRHFDVWQILDVESGHPIPFEQWITVLSTQDVIYLGEEHRNEWHIEAALQVLRGMIENGRHPVLAMEMFGWDGQAALTQYGTNAGLSRDGFLKDVHWDQNWGGTFQDYEPLVVFARNHHVPLLALNPPRPLVRKVAAQGWKKAIHDPEMMTWGMKDEPIVEDTVYRDVILRQLQLCHGGLPQDAYERMYEASMFRDEGMAKTIHGFLRSVSGDSAFIPGPIVSYTGGGHIQYQLPVPNRVLHKRGGDITQKTIYMTSFQPDHPEEVRELLHDGIADYVWLTPVGAHGPARRCR